MSLSDLFKVKQIKAENERLTKELTELRSTFTPEMHEAENIMQLIKNLKIQNDDEQRKLEEKQRIIDNLNNKINELNAIINEKEKQIVKLCDDIELQEYGIYQPRYDFANSLDYKLKLEKIRDEQKSLILKSRAVSGSIDWTVNGSRSQGAKLAKDMQKLLLRAFNSECDDIIEHVKYNNYESSKKRIDKSYEMINKLGRVTGTFISESYYKLKLDELHLALEYRLKKQQEKDEQKEIRARMREEAKLQKELEDARRRSEKEQLHYENALKKVLLQLQTASGAEREELLKKQAEIEEHLHIIETELKELDYREANIKAGYVYVISNIGSFGENVYKIGMTRRLDPMERIDELGDASVPFDFDVHAMIFTDDAPKLENALHKAFENKRVNMVNSRREFFNVTLDEIKKVVAENYDKTAEFIDIPDAEQYRQSLHIRNQILKKKETVNA